MSKSENQSKNFENTLGTENNISLTQKQYLIQNRMIKMISEIFKRNATAAIVMLVLISVYSET